MNFIHLFIPKRQEVIWTLHICLSLETGGLYELVDICLSLKDKRLIWTIDISLSLKDKRLNEL